MKVSALGEVELTNKRFVVQSLVPTESYTCPECDALICDTEEEAKDFLQPLWQVRVRLAELREEAKEKYFDRADGRHYLEELLGEDEAREFKELEEKLIKGAGSHE